MSVGWSQIQCGIDGRVNVSMRRLTITGVALLILLTVVGMLASSVKAFAADVNPDQLIIVQAWQGDYPVALLNQLPEGQKASRVGYIGDSREFERTWQAFKPELAMPKINFDSHIIVFYRNLVFYNRTSIGQIILKQGVVEIFARQTMSALPIEDNVAMSVAVIPRAGVTAVKVDDGTLPVSQPPGELTSGPLNAVYTVAGDLVPVEQGIVDAANPQFPSAITPDIRDDDVMFKVQKGNFVLVPIPLSNPTLDNGLILGGAYFYPQSEQQKREQPASVTAMGALYTSNDSYAAVLGQQNYWDQDRWRFTGAIGFGDLKLGLLGPDSSGSGLSTNWLIRGAFAYAQISREIGHNWYLGSFLRNVDIDQAFVIGITSSQFDIRTQVKSTGLGARIEYDSRDMPTNAYTGRSFKADALFNEPSFGSDESYQSYSLAYSAYHELSAPVVLAWQVAGCQKSGTIPLWDACRVNLRGFPATDYLGDSSVIAQLEARWRMSQRWGLTGFAGAGQINNSFSEVSQRDVIPSYGLGLRFMVLKSKRINMRLDYARSSNSDAIYLTVGEAF